MSHCYEIKVICQIGLNFLNQRHDCLVSFKIFTCRPDRKGMMSI